jgi:hypothetical protein
MRSIGREFDSSYSCVMTDKGSHKGSAQKFGGPWTIMKVEMVADYLNRKKSYWSLWPLGIAASLRGVGVIVMRV